MGIHEGQCFWNVSFCQVHRHIGEELRLELRTFISISLRWEVLVNCEKFASMVCVAVLNRLKIRMNNILKSFVFFKHGNQNRQEKYIAAHTHHANPDIGCLDHIWCFLFHFPPWFFPCCFHFFSSLLRVFFSNGFLFAFHRSFFFLVFRVFLIFPSGEAQHINWANCFLQICDRRCIVAKIAFIPDFIRNSHILFSYIHSHFFTNSSVFWNQNSDQL